MSERKTKEEKSARENRTRRQVERLTWNEPLGESSGAAEVDDEATGDSSFERSMTLRSLTTEETSG